MAFVSLALRILNLERKAESKERELCNYNKHAATLSKFTAVRTEGGCKNSASQEEPGLNVRKLNSRPPKPIALNM